MQISKYLRQTSLASALAVVSMAGNIAAYATSQPVILPTGATITPDAAPDSVFQPLTVALPDYPSYEPDSAQTTAVSPDGKTLLILTSGFNLNLDANGNFQPADSSEFIFVYDISSPSRNMYICDGSVLGANLGVNPSLTLTALAERGMSFIPPAAETAWSDSAQAS